MGCTGSKQAEPSKGKKKDSQRKRSNSVAMVQDASGYQKLSVQKTTEIRTTTVHQSSSRNSAISQVFTSTVKTTNGRPNTYTPIYQRPSLSVPSDATPLSSPIIRLPAAPATRSPMLQKPPTLVVQTRSNDQKYDLSQKAYVLVFHHYSFKNKTHDRQGSIYDMQSIRERFRYYRCDVLDVNENFTKQRVIQKMIEISKKNFNNYSCLVVFIMSHGNVNDTIMAYDEEMYSFHEDIVERCTSNGTLKDKPKIFVVQACRGNSSIVADARPVMSDKVDIITFQSSYQGTVSYRHTSKGSFFMQAFLDMLHKHNQQNILHVNAELNRCFKDDNIPQTPTVSATLRKDLIFGNLLK